MTPPEYTAALQAIRDVVDSIHETLDQVDASLLRKIDAAIETVTSRVDQVGRDLQQQIAAAVTTITDHVDQTERDLTATIGAGVDQVERTVGESARAITSQIGGQIDDLAGGLETAVQLGSAIVADAIEGVGEAVKTAMPSPMDWLTQLYEFGRMAWPTWLEPLKTLVEHAVRGTMDSLEGDAVELLRSALGDVALDAAAPPPVRAIAAQLRAPQHAVALLILIPVLYELGKELVRIPLAPGLEQWRQVVNRAFPVDIPSFEATAMARSRGMLDQGTAVELANRQGFEAKWLELATEMDRPQLTPGQLLDLWLRKAITTAELTAALTRQGYDADTLPLLATLAYSSPTPTDAVRFLMKDALDPAVVAEWDLDAEFEQAFNQDLFDRAGVTKDDAKLYYRSAWTLPSATQGFAMLQRTVDRSTDPTAPVYTDDGLSWSTVISQATLNRLLKTNDVLPFWREKLTQISYTPLTRVDVRRMYQLGVLSGPEVTRAYMDLGYTFENAKRLRAFTEADVKKAGKDESETFRGPIRTRVLTDYVDGVMGPTEAEAVLAEAGYDTAETVGWWRAADNLRAAKARAKIRDDVGRLYVERFWTEQQASERLVRAGFDPDAVAQLLEDWDLDRELAVDKEERKAERDLTKTELVESYREGLLNGEQLHAGLLRLGYDQVEADQLVALERNRQERLSVKEEIESVHVPYVRGTIDRAQVIAEMDKLRVPPSRRQSLLRRWDAERQRGVPTLTDAELKAGITAGVISFPDAEAVLLGRGLAQVNARRLLKTWALSTGTGGLRSGVAAGVITHAEAISQLTRQGFTTADAEKVFSGQALV